MLKAAPPPTDQPLCETCNNAEKCAVGYVCHAKKKAGLNAELARVGGKVRQCPAYTTNTGLRRIFEV